LRAIECRDLALETGAPLTALPQCLNQHVQVAGPRPGVDVAKWMRSQNKVDRLALGDEIFTYGSSSRNILYGPRRVNFDFSLFKEFDIKAGWRLQFRAECFNLFDTPEFDLPNAAIGAGGRNDCRHRRHAAPDSVGPESHLLIDHAGHPTPARCREWNQDTRARSPCDHTARRTRHSHGMTVAPAKPSRRSRSSNPPVEHSHHGLLPNSPQNCDPLTLRDGTENARRR
jgi:hypothetical protein